MRTYIFTAADHNFKKLGEVSIISVDGRTPEEEKIKNACLAKFPKTKFYSLEEVMDNED